MLLEDSPDFGSSANVLIVYFVSQHVLPSAAAAFGRACVAPHSPPSAARWGEALLRCKPVLRDAFLYLLTFSLFTCLPVFMVKKLNTYLFTFKLRKHHVSLFCLFVAVYLLFTFSNG